MSRPYRTAGVSALWNEIARAIRRGEEDPDDIKSFIIVVLQRREPTVIPGEVQLYIARLLSGEIKRAKNRPKLTIERRTIAAFDLVEWVERMEKEYRHRGVSNPKGMAFAAAARSSGVGKSTIERKYRAAIKELRSWPDFGFWRSP